VRIGSVVIRCREFDRMLAFWREALHYVAREPVEGGWVILRDPTGRGPNVSLDRVNEPRAGRRSRLHLDLYTRAQEGEVARLLGLGAVRYPWRYQPGDDFVVLADPDDNLFCVVQIPEAEAESGDHEARVAKAAPGSPPAALGTLAAGAVAFGAVAFGALAIGSLTLGRLVVGRSRIRRLQIDDLEVNRLRVRERTG
jgi:catechol 2,3-dioxygenase-like lactoylglutathione lyase family enzyme